MDEADFRALVGGEVVTLQGAGGDKVELILADIGWARIRAVVFDRLRAIVRNPQ